MAEQNPPHDNACIEGIMERLPQTQCGRCGFKNCRGYAEAILEDIAPINRCAAGGQSGIQLLADYLHLPPIKLDPHFGTEAPLSLAQIDETRCTGCTLCLQACPFDAIIGTGKMMHTVLTALCTGCARCADRCPMACIAMVPISGGKTGRDAWPIEKAQDARARYERHLARITAEEKKEAACRAENHAAKSDFMKAILARAKARKGSEEKKAPADTQKQADTP